MEYADGGPLHRARLYNEQACRARLPALPASSARLDSDRGRRRYCLLDVVVHAWRIDSFDAQTVSPTGPVQPGFVNFQRITLRFLSERNAKGCVAG
jgi:hypothetical protein